MQKETTKKLLSLETLKSLESVLAKYQGLVYSIVYGITLDASDTWDITQEVFLKAHTSDNFFTDDFKQKAWLVTVARNEALKYRRSLKRKFNYFLRYCGAEANSEANTLEEAFIREEDCLQLREYLADLDDEARQLITLKYSANMSYKEISETMDIKIGTVMSRLSRLKEKLGIQLKEAKSNE